MSGDRRLEETVRAGDARTSGAGPPPLAPFGLVLHHDGCFSHEGDALRNRRLRERFERSVVYLPGEGQYVVRIGQFRGMIELQEAGFFVRAVDLEAGELSLSDRTTDALDPATLSLSPIDAALLCRVKHDLIPGGLPARFSHSAQAELLAAVDDRGDGYVIRLGGRLVPFPKL